MLFYVCSALNSPQQIFTIYISYLKQINHFLELFF